ncbi:MAG: nickel-responsive transcriptional regulator NikR [Candidatus Bathyarchaeia archaeon]|nr:nickel-responsive transcriptional regulator NikR [Candidatus Bathyarchaeota archaeon]
MQDKAGVVRFSISLPPALVEEFDSAWKSMNYENRSKAVHDAMRTFISEFKWTRGETEQMAGAILILYYLDKPNLLEKIMEIQHKFRNIISSTTHIHLEEDKCLEMIAVNGKAGEIRNLAQELMPKKGVKQVKIAVVSP